MMTRDQSAQPVAAIFGAAGGIGAATAQEFAAHGWNLLIADRDPAAVAGLGSRLEAERQVRAITAAFDVRDRTCVRQLLERGRSEFGSLDAVVDLVGVAPVRHFLDLADEEWGDCLDINLTSAYVIGQEAARIMVDQGSGSIIFTTSTSAHVAHGSQIAYSVSKAGIDALVRGMAVDLGAHGIRVNAIAPGTIITPMNLQAVTDWEREERLKRIPLGRFGAPDEVARVVHFLASDAASFISGESVRVDAGFLITGIIPPPK